MIGSAEPLKKIYFVVAETSDPEPVLTGSGLRMRRRMRLGWNFSYQSLFKDWDQKHDDDAQSH
jgi:hypothetical protein